MPVDLKVSHNIAASRYEAMVDGQLSVADYRLDSGRMILPHTFVPPGLRGRGIAEKLVRAALADARRAGHKVVPACSYVAAFIKRHPEFEDLVG
jgi:uncharacterized protein